MTMSSNQTSIEVFTYVLETIGISPEVQTVLRSQGVNSIALLMNFNTMELYDLQEKDPSQATYSSTELGAGLLLPTSDVRTHLLGG